MKRVFEIGAKIDDGWSSDNKSSKELKKEYKNPNECRVKIFTEKRRGKTVTIANGIEISPASAKEILKRLKKRLKRGGTFKNSSFEFQGECKMELKNALKDEDFN